VWGDGVRVRPAAVAGRFYPGDADALAALVDALLADVPLPRRRVRPVAVVAPHAGFRFSGPVAATAYAHLAPWRGEVASVVVLGPAHFTPLRGMAIPSVEAFATPLGPVPVDADARAVAAGLSAVVVDDEPHAGEHAIETQLPFLIRTLGPGVPVSSHRRGRHAALCCCRSPVHRARRSRHAWAQAGRAERAGRDGSRTVVG
jgi:AmmeMemoRadiSam system protein B